MSETILPSFFVPYVLTDVTDEKIKHVFEISYGIGKVKFIDRVLKEDLHGNHYSIYIFFETFNFDERTIRLLEHSQIKENPPRFYYDYGEPGYWKVLLNNTERKHNFPSKKINLDDEVPTTTFKHLHSAPCLSNVTERKKNTTMFVPRSVIHKPRSVIHKKTEVPATSRLLEELEKKASEDEMLK
jgi:hypothetical protein